jgi:hypothetical protein
VRKEIVLFVFVLLFPSLVYALTGQGTEENPYLIQSLTDFDEFAGDPNYWDDHIQLNCDIDLDGRTYTTAVIAPDIDNTNYVFDGIPFTGIFDGSENYLLNLKIDSIDDYVGLFGSINSGQINNLGLENINIQAGEKIGGITGKNSGAITDCSVTGNISGNKEVGGVCGQNFGMLVNCFYLGGTVDGDHTTGGLIARNFGKVRASHTIGNVHGRGFVGGLTGSTIGLVEQCFADCTVVGDSYVGGLSGSAGEIDISLLNCYALGQVEGTDMTGGLVGVIHGATPVVVNCYSAAQVISPVGCDEDPQCRVGGFVGLSEFIPEPISCFWDIEASGLSDGVGNMETDPNGVMGLTTSQMQTQSSFTDYGWDFVGESTNGTNDIWRMCIDGIDYPHLSWEYSINGDFACPDGVGTDDLLSLSSNWLNSEELDPGFSYSCDPTFDGVTNLPDFVILAEHWLEE